MNRRSFLAGGLVGAAGTVAAGPPAAAETKTAPKGREGYCLPPPENRIKGSIKEKCYKVKSGRAIKSRRYRKRTYYSLNYEALP